jgi:predicted GH43/DUF377 family glycosyl hydrolase
MTAPVTTPYALKRRGVLLEPAPGIASEAGGVLNPTVYAIGGKTYLMYRSVADVPENFSRLALAELVWENGQLEARRLNRFALEPQAPYELLTPEGQPGIATGGGCEDPRVTMIGGTLYLCYTAYGQDRIPRIALAKSHDGLRWERMGLARFSLYLADTEGGVLPVDLNHVDNKDAMLFPERIHGRYAMLHRPMFRGMVKDCVQPRQSIWISYSDDLIHWDDHRIVAEPEHAWERLKLGGGTQPERVEDGWLVIYHGVDGDRDSDPNRRYSAGAMVLDASDPSIVRYRSPEAILSPDEAAERIGVVNNVVFPTGLWKSPDGAEWLVAYGMADRAIGWASTPVIGTP